MRHLFVFFQDNYDNEFIKAVYQSAVVSYEDLIQDKINYDGAVRLVYHNRDSYKRTTKLLGLMDDFKVRPSPTKQLLYHYASSASPYVVLLSEWSAAHGIPGNCDIPPQGPHGVLGADCPLERL